jgi:hypothetical protein
VLDRRFEHKPIQEESLDELLKAIALWDGGWVIADHVEGQLALLGLKVQAGIEARRGVRDWTWCGFFSAVQPARLVFHRRRWAPCISR